MLTLRIVAPVVARTVLLALCAVLMGVGFVCAALGKFASESS
jgi:hypothetical protein